MVWRLLKVFFILFIACFLSNATYAQLKKQNLHIKILTSSTSSSFRGLSVVNDSVLWVSGSHGTVGCSEDAGKTWHWMTVNGLDHLDFRGISAFSAQKAVVVSAGAPAYIFRTEDQGKHWTKAYENDEDKIFLDGITFWDSKRGLVYGDPIDGHFVVLQTKDGGKHWKMLPLRNRPLAQKGEASFAASGTAIFSLPPKYVWIATGGSVARVLFSKNGGKHWKEWNTPILQGKSTTGIFSVAFLNKKQGICIGGDYAADSVRLNNACLTSDGGKTWQKPLINPYGYQSCVLYVNPQTILATGTSGVNVSFNEGVTWQLVTHRGYHVVQKARKGSAVYLAGSSGQVAQITGFPHK